MVLRMSKYTGLKCPVCKETFHDNDDIVVCPECGAPYHRNCYQQTGHCLYEEKHGTGQAWQTPEHTHQKDGDKLCPRCGVNNSSDALFCSKCGQSLSYNSQSQGQAPPDTAESYAPPSPDSGREPGGFTYPYPFDPMGGVNPKDHIEGIEAGDIAKFVQANTPYYMGRFLNLSAFKKGRFHFSAFLFGGGWFLYRKQYVLGTILTAFQVVVTIVTSALQYYYTVPLINELLPNTITPYSYYLGFLQVWDALAAKSPLTLFLVMLPTILILLQFVERILCGIFANKIYLKYCVKKINTIQTEATTGHEYEAKLKEKGGINTPLAFSLMICYFIISFIPILF